MARRPATVPDGWHHGGWLVTKPRVGEDVASVSVQFWEVQYLYGHPCQWDGTQFNPGDTVDELADALTGIPMRNATEPTQVTIGGYSGNLTVEFKRLVRRVATHQPR